MQAKWKAFSFWVALPYLFFTLSIVGVGVSQHGIRFLSGVLNPKLHVFALAFGFAEAVIGIPLLWVLPIRKKSVGCAVGVVIAIAIIWAYAAIAMNFFGGFEENIGIFLSALAMAPPSGLAGFYAGWLRANDNVVRGTAS